MTNYTLPTTDRLAADVNPLLDEIAQFTPEQADAVEIGAVTVLGLLYETVNDLQAKVRAEAAAQGYPQSEADMHFDAVMGDLFEPFDERVKALQNAVRKAQIKAQTDALDEFLTGLLTGIVGEDKAGSIMAEAIAESDRMLAQIDAGEKTIDDLFMETFLPVAV